MSSIRIHLHFCFWTRRPATRRQRTVINYKDHLSDQPANTTKWGHLASCEICPTLAIWWIWTSVVSGKFLNMKRKLINCARWQIYWWWWFTFVYLFTSLFMWVGFLYAANLINFVSFVKVLSFFNYFFYLANIAILWKKILLSSFTSQITFLYRFSTSRQTLTWIPDTFFTALLSGRISSLRDETSGIFFDRDSSLFSIILNYSFLCCTKFS